MCNHNMEWPVPQSSRLSFSIATAVPVSLISRPSTGGGNTSTHRSQSKGENDSHVENEQPEKLPQRSTTLQEQPDTRTLCDIEFQYIRHCSLRSLSLSVSLTRTASVARLFTFGSFTIFGCILHPYLVLYKYSCISQNANRFGPPGKQDSQFVTGRARPIPGDMPQSSKLLCFCSVCHTSKGSPQEKQITLSVAQPDF